MQAEPSTGPGPLSKKAELLEQIADAEERLTKLESEGVAAATPLKAKFHDVRARVESLHDVGREPA